MTGYRERHRSDFDLVDDGERTEEVWRSPGKSKKKNQMRRGAISDLRHIDLISRLIIKHHAVDDK